MAPKPKLTADGRIDIWSSKNAPANDIDAFIQMSPKEAQAKLKELRALIKKLAPRAEETISYRMPVFKLDGKGLAGFAGYKQHIGFYPMSGTFLENYKKELAEYKTSKGAMQLPLTKSLPIKLITKIVKDKIKEIQATKKIN